MRIIGSFVFCFFAFVGCGIKDKSSKEKNQENVQQFDQKLYEYVWGKSLSEYQENTIAVYGFIWFDAITDRLPKGSYTVYERPNGYECGKLTAVAETDLSMPVIEDSTIENNIRFSQWRLVKIIAEVTDTSKARISNIEVSEYQYPDYEESGFEEVTKNYLNSFPENHSQVYIDGYVEQKAEVFYIEETLTKSAYELLMFKMSNHDLGKDVYLLVNSGSKPNEGQRIPSLDNKPPCKLNDMNRTLVGSHKVRVYGILEFDWKKDHLAKINVEAIKILK